MNTNQWLGLALVVVVAALIWSFSWHACLYWHGRLIGQPNGPAAPPPPPPPPPGPPPVPRALGWQDWAGAQDRTYQIPRAADPMDVAAAAYQLGQQRATADQTTAEVDTIWAEIESRPDLGRYR